MELSEVNLVPRLGIITLPVKVVRKLVIEYFATEKHREVRQIQGVKIVKIMVLHTRIFCDENLLDLMTSESVLANPANFGDREEV